MPVEYTPQPEVSKDRVSADTIVLKPPISETLPTVPIFAEKKQAEQQTISRPKPTKPKRKSPLVESWSGSAVMYWTFEVLLALGMIIFAAILWRQDGLFTIRFVGAQIASFRDADLWKQWLIPIFFTAGFLGAYPRKSLRLKMNKALELWQQTQEDSAADKYYALRKSIIKRFIAATFIQLVNMATSFSGLILTISGKTYEFFVPITFPKEGIGLLIPTFLVSGILAFGPELITRWALPYLGELLRRAWEIISNGVPTRVKV
ncbi:hypothetical protein [Herpetosiphon geysericola]|uniref:Uncharacterized protein n=1 Tax=Herpetosiphon geysericola TaxID=70996 RepID=A0A0P6XWS3_9CHLR|nr:hypothetical protein [Herpetosiphon geysericola]KPL79991.1 hypothetical protein SE18_25740 [Herpetosiphon geysericola]